MRITANPQATETAGKDQGSSQKHNVFGFRSPKNTPRPATTINRSKQPEHHTGDDSGNTVSSTEEIPISAPPAVSPSSPPSPNQSSVSIDGQTNPNQADGVSMKDAAPDIPSASSVRATRNAVTELLWESAEPYFSYTTEQGRKWCREVEQLSCVWEDSLLCSKPRDLSPDFDDAIAIVGTQDDDDEDEASPRRWGHFCGSGESIAPWISTAVTSSKRSQPKQSKPVESHHTPVKFSSIPTPTPPIVLSRIHEDIEVIPGHHVQVRLPPIHPILQTSPVIVEETIRAVTPSGDSCKAVPQQPMIDAIVDLSTMTSTSPPIRCFEVKPEEAMELERSISELTMRSSYAATDMALQKIPEHRRMAYYAVGRHHRQSGRGGNRRCYFSGKLILGGTPFYAGSVLQGLRTLVVFCLPSSIGLPSKDTMLLLNVPHPELSNRSDSHSTGTTTLKGLRLLKSGTNGSKQSTPSYASHYTQHSQNLGASHATGNSTIRSSGRKSQNRVASGASTAGSKVSRLSSLDDLSLSVEGDLDPNWSLDRDTLLKVLPPASPELLRSMATLYPDQFETLPVQVRDARQWKLYVKFCFFSGLPISDGEMHYKVRDAIAEQVYGEEIVLSHDVMEAATGASAEILTLPNRTVLRYLRKHYAQQCQKLDDRVFQRASWERVAPEV
jgi:hypothetical protein